MKQLLLATLLFSTFSVKAAYIVPMNGDGAVAFSQNGGATELVVQAIERAKIEALLQAPTSAGPASLCYTKLQTNGAELPLFSCPIDATWPLPNVHFGEVVVISPNSGYILL